MCLCCWPQHAGTSPCARLTGRVTLVWECVWGRKIGLYNQRLTAWHLRGWESLSSLSCHQLRSERRLHSWLWRWGQRFDVICRLAPDLLRSALGAADAIDKQDDCLLVYFGVVPLTSMDCCAHEPEKRTEFVLSAWEASGGTTVAKYCPCAPGAAMGFTWGLPWRHQASGNTTGRSTEASWQLGHEFWTKWKRRQIALSSGESLPV